MPVDGERFRHQQRSFFENADVEHFHWQTANPLIAATERELLADFPFPLRGTVLEVGCGEGGNLANLVAVVRGDARLVVGMDLFERKVAFGQRQVATARFVCGDALALPFKDGSFDAVLCQFGLMFLPDPDRGLREMLRVLKPGAWTSLVIFAAGGTPESVLAASIVRSRLGEETPTPERLSSASLGAPGVLKRRLEAAGFQAVESHELTVPLRLPSAADAGRYLREIHPTLEEMMAPLSADQREAVWQQVDEALAAFEGPNGFESPNRVVVVAGMRAITPTVA